MYGSSRSYATQQALQYVEARPLFLDTETTGLDGSAEIVEICILDADGEPLLNTLVRPRKSIPFDAYRIHGISNEMVQTAPSWLEVWPQAREVLHGQTVGIYNADFDLRMLKQTQRANGLTWPTVEMQSFCIMRLYSDYLGTSQFISLEKAGQRLGLRLPNDHRALADSRLARAVLRRLAGVTP